MPASEAHGPFAVHVADCKAILAKLTAHVEAADRLPAESVSWGNVADADRVLYFLRQAEFAAGVGEEPVS